MLLALVGSAPVAYAEVVDNSANSASAWEAEGNVRCSDYFSNDVVLEMSTSGLLSEETLSGSFNPQDDSTAGGYTDDETVTYTVTDDIAGNPIEFKFSSSTRINAVIVKQGRTVNFYMMPYGGVSYDEVLDLDDGVPDDGVDMEISAVSFCYGIPGGESEPVAMEACNFNIEGACQENEAFECNVENGLLSCCSCQRDANGDPTGNAIPGCLIEDPSGADSCAEQGINIESLNPVFTGTGSDIVCYKVKKRLTCYEF
jgi:hypothetical protein